MKGRIFVVNHTFMENINDTMEIKAKLPPLKEKRGKSFPKKEILSIQSLTSIIADIYQLQLGDYVFLWETKGNNADSYIWGVYRIISNPFFDYAEPNYIKVKIELAYSFKNPITEYNILNDPYNKIELWNIVGKKVAGKSRATTPLSPYETEFLIQKLINENPDYKFYENCSKKVKVSNEIKINFKKYKNKEITKYSELNYNDISYINENGTVKYEKFMELLFNMIIKDNNKSALSKLNINLDNIFWYANYLPYSIDQSEIDYLIMESSDNVNVDKINLLEFQRGKLNEDHINKALLYSKWINSKLAKGSNLTTPIIICEKFADLETIILKKEKLYDTKSLEVYTINLKDGIINIEKRR